MTDLPERIAAYTYKPGWRFDLVLRIRATVQDSRDPEKTFPLQGRFQVPADIGRWDDARLDAWLKRVISRMDDHERDEWLRRDGNLVNDPHGEAK